MAILWRSEVLFFIDPEPWIDVEEIRFQRFIHIESLERFLPMSGNW